MAYRPRSTVTRFSRHARRHPQYRLGDPPKGVRRRRRIAPAFWLLLPGAMAVLLFGPMLGDAAAGMLRGEGDCIPVALIDGDTFRGWCAGEGLTSVRIIGIDTPELGARCPAEFVGAARATWALRRHLWTAGRFETVARGTDRHGRVLGRVIVDGVPLATRMVEQGVARRYGGGRRAGWCGGERRHG